MVKHVGRMTTGKWKNTEKKKPLRFSDIVHHKRRPWWSSGYHTRLWIRSLQVQTQPGSMDFFRT